MKSYMETVPTTKYIKELENACFLLHHKLQDVIPTFVIAMLLFHWKQGLPLEEQDKCFLS